MKVTTSTSTKPLLLSSISYTHNLSYADNKLRSFWSCFRWMCVDQSDVRHAIISWSLFLLGVFIPITSHIILSYALTHRAYDVVV
ncbi:hypothetical protein B296_00052911 [Ensete ventricosum]|uniref:Uncharacterized protein n=1 Tax=Ensete ventricosum TaxID=4639 RepID=A0A426XB15_ENSVE|nr:hypothetical protein B296_00052911 [Ensete ventricosum]